MFTVDIKQIKQFGKELKRYGDNILPKVIRNTLNTAAFDTRKTAVGFIEDNFILRNRWTIRNVRVKKATSLDINVMVSEVGSSLPYMVKQEEGAIVTPVRESFAIPSNESRVGRDKNRMVSSRYKINKLGKFGKSNKKFFVGAVRHTQKKAIFQKMRRGKLRLLRYIVKTPYKIKPTHWLSQSTVTNLESIFFAESHRMVRKLRFIS